MSKRSCGDCTKCCEGWLEGEALGHKFYPGRPCHFIAIGKGCSVYSKRPKDPCQSYKCAWLVDENIPEWMKPSEINAIVDYRTTSNGISYISANEAGSILSSQVLTWIIQYALSNNLNLLWKVNQGLHWIGSPEFIEAIQEDTKGKTVHQEASHHLQASEE